MLWCVVWVAWPARRRADAMPEPSERAGHADDLCSWQPKLRPGAIDRKVTPSQGGEMIRKPGASRRQRNDSRQAFQVLELAERVGFEPTNTREDVTGIPVQRLRPLGHLSAPVDILSGARRLHGGQGVRQSRFRRRAGRPGPGRGRAGRTQSAAAAVHRRSGPCGPGPT